MIITISRDCGSARRDYRIQCPDDARFSKFRFRTFSRSRISM